MAVFFSLGVIISPLFAQEGAGAAAPTTPMPPTAARKVFDEKMTQYKESVKQLRSLKEEYQTASPARRDEIIASFNPLVKETELTQQNIIPSAIAVWQESGGQDPEISQFLYGMLQWMTIGRENYEVAYDIAQAILSKPFPAEVGSALDVLYAFGSVAAFNTMHLDDAETWFTKAQATNAVEKADPENKMHLRDMITHVLPEYKKVWANEMAIREKEAGEELPRVLVKTTKGDIVIELFANEAPNAVGNFLTLVSQKFYNDTPFHRVLPFFMAQGGDPTGTGTGGPSYCIPCECGQKNARMHFRGSLSMAHAGMDTGGSQFFLTFVPTSFLNGKHTVFGRVVEGMKVLSDIQRIDPQDENLPAPDKIIEATIIRGIPTEFQKLPRRR